MPSNLVRINSKVLCQQLPCRALNRSWGDTPFSAAAANHNADLLRGDHAGSLAHDAGEWEQGGPALQGHAAVQPIPQLHVQQQWQAAVCQCIGNGWHVLQSSGYAPLASPSVVSASVTDAPKPFSMTPTLLSTPSVPLPECQQVHVSSKSGGAAVYCRS